MFANMKGKPRGFASPNYDREKRFEARRRGGSAKVPKGFAKMTPERVREIAASGGRAGGNGRKGQPDDPFDVV